MFHIDLGGDPPTVQIGSSPEVLVRLQDRTAEVRPLAHHGYSAGYLRRCLEVQARDALSRVLPGAGGAAGRTRGGPR
jgi:hypothetical protein